MKYQSDVISLYKFPFPGLSPVFPHSSFRRLVVLHVELPEIQARGQLNPEVVCGLSRSQRQVSDNFESQTSSTSQTSTKNLPAASLYFAERLRMFSSSLLSPGRPNASA